MFISLIKGTMRFINAFFFGPTNNMTDVFPLNYFIVKK